MQVVVAGLGSIGTRHARILKDLGADVTTVSRRGGVGDEEDLHAALRRRPNALFVIATETAAHATALSIADAVGHVGPVVVEKPLGAKLDEFPARNDSRAIWVAYNLRYLPVVESFKAELEKLDEPLISVHAYVGQFLGDWRAGRNVRHTYSAKRSAGGGALRDLSHELDLLMWLWGVPEVVAALGGRVSNITIDSDDCWNILMRMRRGINVSLALNYFDRPARRFLHAVSADKTLSADLIEQTLRVNETLSHYPAGPDDSYRAMWADILRSVQTGVGCRACNYANGRDVLSVIERCEEAADNAWGVAVGV